MTKDLARTVNNSISRISYLSGDALRESKFVRTKGDWFMFELDVMRSKQLSLEGMAMNADTPEEEAQFQTLSDNITNWFQRNEPVIEEVKDKLFLNTNL